MSPLRKAAMQTNSSSVDVLAVFDSDATYPRPVRFKVFENGVKKTVSVSEITNIATLGAGGMTRLEYSCRSAGHSGTISYKLLYYYNQFKWELERVK